MSTLTIWAQEGLPHASNVPVVLWGAFLPDDAPAGWYSMPEEVHQKRESLRNDYLAWLHEVGLATMRGSALADRMAIRPGLSYWWMTIPADYSLDANAPTYIAVRLMALAALADRLGATTVRIVTSDRTLAQLLKSWTQATGRSFDAQLSARPKRTRENLYRAFPLLAALRIVIGHAGIPRHVKKEAEYSPQSGQQTGILVIDYLAHFSSDAVEKGRFASNFWGPLVEMLDDADEPVRWLHISSEMASTTVINRDSGLVGRFDTTAAKQSHDLLHRYLSWSVVARSCLDYLKVVRFGLTVRPRSRIFRESGTGASLWHGFRTPFRDQFFGRTAMINCLWLNLFEEALDNLPLQRLGVYLFENQPWEMALIHAWRKAGHGELLGVAHSTTRFWDTRYFKDPRDQWAESGMNSMPWPDMVAVNGPMMRQACEQANYPQERIVDLEALRYLDLDESPPSSRMSAIHDVLICGEYAPEAAKHLLTLVVDALAMTPFPIDATYRAHPAFLGPAPELGPRLRMDSHSTIREALAHADLVVCGATSSVAIEAACNGLPFIIVADPQTFLTCPVENTDGSIIASSARALAHAFSVPPGVTAQSSRSAVKVFNTNPALQQWRAVLLGAKALKMGDWEIPVRSPGRPRRHVDPGRLPLTD